MSRLVCSFTGHRPKSFPWKYNETASDCMTLKKVLAEQITVLADSGAAGFISGMALGVDLWAAQIVLDLRMKNQALKLCCALPCEGQEKKLMECPKGHHSKSTIDMDNINKRKGAPSFV